MTRLYVAAGMLQVGSMRAEVIFNTRQASVAYEHPNGSYRAFSVPLPLGSVDEGGCHTCFLHESAERVDGKGESSKARQ